MGNLHITTTGTAAIETYVMKFLAHSFCVDGNARGGLEL